MEEAFILKRGRGCSPLLNTRVQVRTGSGPRFGGGGSISSECFSFLSEFGGEEADVDVVGMLVALGRIGETL